ncbi:MAG: hypothetical protein L3J17_02065 [Candidatus Jettenia sp.]|nr:MAG: hypothetical protein L3J17_02065 [Candidatus Jettenia sp.]
MSNEKVVTLSADVWRKTESNMDYVRGLLTLIMDLACCKTPNPSETVIPESLFPIVLEAEERMEEIQNAFFYGKLEDKENS